MNRIYSLPGALFRASAVVLISMMLFATFAVQAEDKRIGFARVEVDGFHQAVLDSLELTRFVEDEGFRGDRGLGLVFVLCHYSRNTK